MNRCFTPSRWPAVTCTIALLACTGLADARAGDGKSGALRVLTLAEALTLASQRNRTLAVENARLLQAQTAVEQAWVALFPTVTVQGRYAHNYKRFELGFAGAPLLIQPSEQFDTSINAVAPLLVPAAYQALDAVKHSVAAAEAGLQISETAVMVGVARTFYAAWISDEVLAAHQSNIDVARATLDNAKARFAAGTVTRVDVGRAELALIHAEHVQREAGQARRQTYRALSTLIQLKEPFVVEVTPMEPERHDESELGSALAARPEFRMFDLNLKSAEAERKAHGWRWAPTLSLLGNARRFNYDNFARDRYAWSLGVQLDWALFDGGARDVARHRSAAVSMEAQARVEVLRDQIRDDLADGRALLDTKLAGLQAAERSVELARETLELVRAQYEAGNITQVDLLSAQDALANTRVAEARARFDVAAADLALRHAAGTFPPR